MIWRRRVKCTGEVPLRRKPKREVFLTQIGDASSRFTVFLEHCLPSHRYDEINSHIYVSRTPLSPLQIVSIAPALPPPSNMPTPAVSSPVLKPPYQHSCPSLLRISLPIIILLVLILTVFHLPLPTHFNTTSLAKKNLLSEVPSLSDNPPLTSIADPPVKEKEGEKDEDGKDEEDEQPQHERIEQEQQIIQPIPPVQKQPPPPPLSTSNRCILFPLNPSASLWQFNSRTLCTFTHFCINTTTSHQPTLHLPLSASCALSSTPDLLVHTADHRLPEWQGGCEDLRQRALCILGEGSERDDPVCPLLADLAQPPQAQGEEENKEEVVVFVPRFPYMANIYHFLTVATGLIHVLDELPRLVEGFAGRKARIVCRGWEIEAGWQKELLRVLLEGRADVEEIEYLGMRSGCWKGAVVVMGIRAHVNLWPFLNATDVPVDGRGVPKAALRFKQRFYEEFEIEGKRIEEDKGESGGKMVSELPPLVVGYSRRLGIEDSVGKSVHAGGTKRRFNKEDEEWFGEMLEEECERGGVRLKVFTITGDESLREQVRNIVDVGFLVGIHGANLVNGVFMRPFGSLFEIQPNGSASPCYISGANSGLAYWKHESLLRATMEESGCEPDDEHCRTKLRQRLVKIGTESDRMEIRRIVRMGIDRLNELHRSFPDGIPVVYNESTAYYDVHTAG